jgi:PIN domain nuclease of toxin-antitoxin system
LPIDRLLVAQAMEECLVVVTADPMFARYGVPPSLAWWLFKMRSPA